MPLYEYQCDKCGNSFEVMQKFSDQPLTVHDTCGGHLRKLVSAPAFHLKGSGWYITDYGKGGQGPKSDNGASAKSDGSKSETKSDTSAAKADTPAPATTTSSTSSDTK